MCLERVFKHAILIFTLNWIPEFSTKTLDYEFLFLTSSAQSKFLIESEYLEHGFHWMSIATFVYPFTSSPNVTLSKRNDHFRLVTLIGEFKEDNSTYDLPLKNSVLLNFDISESILVSFLPKEYLNYTSVKSNKDINNNVYFVQLPRFIFQKSLVHKFNERYSVKNSFHQSAIVINNFRPLYIFDINTLVELRRKIPRRLNFLGARIIGVSELKKGLVEMNEFGKVIFYGGYNVEEFRYMRDFLNFTEDTVPWKGYASLDSNGQLLGMGQQVNDAEADISIQSQEMLLYRTEKLTFLIPNLYNIETLYAFFKQSSSTFITNPYIKVFTTETWIVYFFTWGIIGISLQTGIVFLDKSYEKCTIYNQEFHHERPQNSLLNTWNWIIATICQQGAPLPATTYHIKIILIVSLFFSYFIFQVFNCALLAVLSHPNDLIHSFSDILNHKYKLFHEKDTNNAYDFLQDLRKNKLIDHEIDKSVYSVLADEGLIQIQKRKAAFISPVYLFYPKLSQSISPEKLCQIVSKVKVEGFTTRSAMFIKKNSPYTEYFFYALMRMTEFGVRDRLSKKYRVNGVTLRCLEDIPRAPEPVRIENTISNSILIAGGLLLSMLILLLELIIYRPGRISDTFGLQL